MKVRQFLSPVWKSFYSRSFYLQAASAGHLRALFFLFVICIACAAASSVKLHLELSAALKNEVSFLVAQIPDIHISGGRLSTVSPQGASAVKEPLYAIRGKNGELLAVIDETAASAPEGLGGAKIYVTGSEVAVMDSDAMPGVYSFSQLHDIVLDRETLMGWALKAYYFAGLVVFPFLLAGVVFYRFVQTALVSLFAYIFFLSIKRSRRFSFCLALAAYSLIPPVIVGTIADLATGVDYVGFFPTLLISAVIIVLAVRTSDEKKDL